VPNGSRRQLILSIVATDSSFERVTLRDGEAWQGNCIHCRRRLLVELSGEPIGAVTVEHILPRRHGGSDELVNLALACAPCNHQKGYRLDHRRADDPVLRRVIETLRSRRLARWRDPS
jgi:5-methylcytosine-specific restriction endonuclease McrA